MSDPGFRVIKPVPLYLCGFQGCPLTFYHRRSLVIHRKAAHQLQARYRCVECGKEFRYRSALATHYTIHVFRSKKEKCPVCRSLFQTARSLRRHQNQYRHFIDE